MSSHAYGWCPGLEYSCNEGRGFALSSLPLCCSRCLVEKLVTKQVLIVFTEAANADVFWRLIQPKGRKWEKMRPHESTARSHCSKNSFEMRRAYLNLFLSSVRIFKWMLKYSLPVYLWNSQNIWVLSWLHLSPMTSPSVDNGWGRDCKRWGQWKCCVVGPAV